METSSRLQVIIVGAGKITLLSKSLYEHRLTECRGLGGLAAGAFLREYADVTV
jgi:hypothetical protein